MSQPCISACNVWATSSDLCYPCDAYTFDIGLFDEMLPLASDVLYELSGKQFPGICQDKVRPCGAAGSEHLTRDTHGNYRYSTCSCRGGSGCSCHHAYELPLGVYPLNAIVEIRLAMDTYNPAWLSGAGTAVLSSSLYRIDDYRWLVRQPNTDGSNPGWPCCQRLDKPVSTQDTFEVEFTYGASPPAAGVHAAAALACELALACQPDTVGQCRLPRKVRSIVRQGVTMEMIDPILFIDRGLTGIYEVDLFLKTFNPNGLTRRASVISPDIRRRARRAAT